MLSTDTRMVALELPGRLWIPISMLARKLGVGIILGVVAKFSPLRRASISWLVSCRLDKLTPNDFCRCSLGCS